MARVVIVGAGQGGVQAAASLRSEGWEGEIVLIGDEPALPYQRPPLSKEYLAGKPGRALELRAPVFFENHRIALRTGERVEQIEDGVVHVGEERIEFDSLILATGARNRMLTIPGAELPHVHYLRTRQEADALRASIPNATRVAIIGGGFIGLEVAAVCRGHGKQVTVIESAPRLMARVVCPPISEYFRATHAAQGVEMLFGAQAQAITATHVVTSQASVAADLVIAGIGVLPNTALAGNLSVANGIAVDEFLRTSDPRIFAIGDCAEFPCIYSDTRVRLESVQNSVDQAIAAARTIAGKPAAYAAIPWFWTDQFDIRMQMAGLAPAWDELVTRGDPDSRKFSVVYFRDGRLVAADTVNRPGDHLAFRRLIANRSKITPLQAADETFELKSAV